MKRSAAILALCLSGCAAMTPQQRAERAVADHGPFCGAIGLQPGSPDWQQCVLVQYQQEQASDDQRRAAASVLGAALIKSSRPTVTPIAPLPKPVACRWVGPTWVCS